MIDLARSPSQIGSILRNARKRKGLTQTQLADLTALRQETISMIENGHPPTIQTILTVLAALDLELRIVPRSRGEWPAR